VAKAGPQPISTNPLSVVEALGTAGIDTNNADLSGLLLTRNGRVYPLNLDSLNQQDSELQHVFLKGGDQLYLPYNDNKRIYVMGEVNQPRALSFKTATMNLSDVLGSVGGLSQTTSNGNAVYVIRGVENLDVEPAKIYQLEAQSPTAMALASHFEVRPQDVVYVGPANVTRWNRFISQLVPSASIVGTGASAAKNWSEFSNNSK
jgi:polysaccharide export outer membrane protein